MTAAEKLPTQRPDDGELCSAIQESLQDHFGDTRRVARVRRRRSDYSSSFLIEELEVQLEDETCLQLIFKDLSRKGMLEDASRTKPSFLFNPLREIDAYRILARRRLGTAVCFGVKVCSSADRYWLFLEKSPGIQLHQVGDFSVWREAARWLANMHRDLAGEVATAEQRGHLVKHTRDYYRRWLVRAQANTAQSDRSEIGEARRAWIASIAGRYDRIVDRLAGLPRTMIHGEFYSSNILVDRSDEELRICPVDWETAGIGPGLIDLAALSAGNWSDEEKKSLAMAYYDALGPDRPTQDEFLTSLACCQLHWAILWVGWARQWYPPPEHARDWLQEANALAASLEARFDSH